MSQHGTDSFTNDLLCFDSFLQIHFPTLINENEHFLKSFGRVHFVVFEPGVAFAVVLQQQEVAQQLRQMRLQTGVDGQVDAAAAGILQQAPTDGLTARLSERKRDAAADAVVPLRERFRGKEKTVPVCVCVCVCV